MGTPVYVAPEIVKKESYEGELVDVFSCGVVLFIMVTGEYPFSWAHRDDERYRLIKDMNFKTFWERYEPLNLSAQIKDLITNMLAYKTEERFHFEEVLAHEWCFATDQSTSGESLIDNYSENS